MRPDRPGSGEVARHAHGCLLQQVAETDSALRRAGLVDHRQGVVAGAEHAGERHVEMLVAADGRTFGASVAGEPVAHAADLEQAEARRLAADERADEIVGRVGEQVLRRGVLHHLAVAEDDDALAETHRLVDVVGDHEDGLAGRRVDADHLGLQRVAGDGVEGAEGLVHQQDVGVCGERAGKADALLLAAGELMRAPVAEGRRVELDQGHQFVDALVDALLRPAEQARHGGDIVADAPVGKQADRLDDVAETAAQRHRIEGGDVVVVDADRTGVRRDQPVDQPERGGFAGARGADEHAEFVARNGEGDLVEGDVAVKALGDFIE